MTTNGHLKQDVDIIMAHERERERESPTHHIVFFKHELGLEEQGHVWCFSCKFVETLALLVFHRIATCA